MNTMSSDNDDDDDCDNDDDDAKAFRPPLAVHRHVKCAAKGPDPRQIKGNGLALPRLPSEGSHQQQTLRHTGEVVERVKETNKPDV